jgi:hypothetical protein
MLLDLIRRKALGLTEISTMSNGFPAKALAAMDLHHLLSIIRLLGRYRLIGFGQENPSGDATIFRAAAALLNDWPKSLHDLMTDLGFSYRTRRTSRVSTMQESFLEALQLISCKAGERQTQFIDDVIEHFVREQIQQAEAAYDKRSQYRRERFNQLNNAVDLGYS